MRNNSSNPIFESIYLPEYQEVLMFTSRSTGDYTVSHWHDAIEIIYIDQGDLTVTVAEHDYELTANTFFVINSKVIHATNCRHGNRGLVIKIPQDLLKHFIPNITHLLFNVPFESNHDSKILLSMKKHLQNLYQLQLNPTEGTKLKINSLLYDFLYIMYENFRVELPKATYLKHTKNLSVLSDIMTYTEKNHASLIRIEEIANVSGFQPKYFCRFFKTNIGCTYLQYLNQLRIQYIYQDLIETDLPIYQILERHGFTNYKLFRQMFYERFQDTPRNIRKNSNHMPFI